MVMTTEKGRLSGWKRFRLFFVVFAVVLVLSAIKFIVHSLGFEFLALNTLFTSGIAGAIFIIGFLLSSVLSDYKEADKIPAEIRVNLEGICGDVQALRGQYPDLDTRPFLNLSIFLVEKIRAGLSHENGHVGLPPALDAIDRFSPLIAQLDKLEVPSNQIVRLKNLQDGLRRSILRMYHIQKIQFVPSAHVLVHTLVASILLLLLALKTEGSPESALMFGFIAYMFVYALYLVRVLEQPFMKEHGSFDDVSLFLLTELSEKFTAARSPVAEGRRLR